MKPITMTNLCVAPVLTQADAHAIVHGMVWLHLQVTTDALTYLTKYLSGEQKGRRLGHHDVQPLQVD